MIKAIIFDFGNVICSFDNDIFINKIAKYTDKSFEELNTKVYKEPNLNRLYEMGLISSEEFFKKTSELCDLNISKESFIEAYTNIFLPIAPTFELIKKLKKNYKLALLSNIGEWDFNHGIKPTEIFELFDAISLSFEVNAMKPDSKIYEDCLKKLNLKPDECVYIDDIKKYSDKANNLGLYSINYSSSVNLEKSLKSLGISY